ncbi:MAG: hypothetical protein KME42_21350 [Tildeniella nuda ZEHNDER 1965/U140]|jgi:D-beta-D-heptose 7-phosphate kinase/D-beta-D-heptose 1-phosphate adenosyltransferase|nr:hypothetical protein [Tildeniella nuda ZEHNDER 1965/U140]
MHTNVSSLINTFADRHIIVIGEAMLDSYLLGEATRLCQEAPVPVVALRDRQDIPGGAANVAVNLRSLGAQVSLLSVIGDDVEGELLQHALVRYGVETEVLLQQPLRRTLVKSRVMAASQMLVRMDQGSTEAIAPDTERQLIQQLTDRFMPCDAIVISDYSYGLLTPQVIEAIAQLQAQVPKLLVVDSKRLASYRSIGVTAVKPNYEEAMRLLASQMAIALDDQTKTRLEQIAQHRHQLLDRTGAKFAIVTLDVDGAIILQRERSPHLIPAKAITCVNPTGAGDTFISALTLALAVGTSITVAAELAATAAAIVVAKDGTATCSAEELQIAIAADSKLQVDQFQEETSGDGINELTEVA